MRRLFTFLILPGLLLLSIQPVAAAAPSAGALAAARVRQAQLAQVRAQLGESLASNLQAQDQLAQALAANRREVDLLNGQVAESEARLGALAAEIRELDARRSVLEAQIEVERRQLDRLARAIYVQPDSLVLSMAEAGSLGDALSQAAGLQSASAHARRVQQQLERDQAQLASDRRRQGEAQAQQASLRTSLQAKSDRLRQLGAQQQRSLSELQARAAASQAEMASVSLQSSATAAYIASALEAQQAEAGAAAYQAVWEQVQVLNGNDPDDAGSGSGFGYPLPDAPVTQGFGPSPYWFEPPFRGYAHFHTGIDYAAPRGTPVRAAAAGTVVLAGFNSGGYGNYVVISHGGGVDTLYGHLDSIAVHTGQHVDRGQGVGTEGSTGNSTGPHLHFEIRRAGVPVDPGSLLR